MYLAFETDGDLEMEFMVAEQLKMTVASLRDQMSQDEYLRWTVYFARKAQRREINE